VSQEKKFIVEPHIPPFAEFERWKEPPPTSQF
jgi:hypothetical protein